MKWLSGRRLCCAAHGLSCLITTRTPSSEHTLLFDTDPDESIFERNVIRLGVDMGGVDAMADSITSRAARRPQAVREGARRVRVHTTSAPIAEPIEPDDPTRLDHPDFRRRRETA
jgi:hypothetical protein